MTWPVKEIVYGSYDWLLREIGVLLDFGADFAAWSHEQIGIADSCIQSGLKRFYFPPPVQKEGGERHKWSFLYPTFSLNLATGVSSYDLPDNFQGGLDGFTFLNNRRVSMANEADIRALQTKENAPSAAPKLAAIRPKIVEGATTQLWEVVFYPTPDQVYSLTYCYNVNPGTIGPDAQFPLGGRSHSETILESVLAIAEDRVLKQPRGKHWEAFMERLGSSVQTDLLTRNSDESSWEVVEPAYGTYSYLAREVGGVMGYGYNPQTWSYQQERRVNSIVQNGIRRFYFPPPIGEAAHSWSFLRPVASMNLVTNQDVYDLPTDFGMVLADVTFSADDKQERLEVIGDEKIRALRSKALLNGPPKYCSVRPKSSNYSTEQTWVLAVYPTPEKNYTVNFRYNVSPPDASVENPYPLGTRAHAETVLASCLAEAEVAATGARGPHTERFLERLAASVSLDRMAMA